MNVLSEAQAAWIAGIVEGEGNFCLNGKNGKKTPSVRISVGMSDHDVIYRLQEFTGVGNIRPKKIQEPHHKPCLVWDVARQQDVVDLINAMLPWLLARKTKEALVLRDFSVYRMSRKLNSDCICALEGCEINLEGRDVRTKYCTRSHKSIDGMKRFNERKK